MTENAQLYERMSVPMLMPELRHLRGEFEKLTTRGKRPSRNSTSG
jgi:hypothetical protein